MPRIFLSQSLLGEWLSAGSVEIDGDLLQLPSADETWSLYLNPAALFESVDGGGADPNEVVGCVKSSQELAQLGGEFFETSASIGDTFYVVKPGFLAMPLSSEGTELRLDGPAWDRLMQALSGRPGAQSRAR